MLIVYLKMEKKRIWLLGLATLFSQISTKKMNDGDIYHWCDVGCHFNINGYKRLNEYFEMIEKEESGFLGFQYKKPYLKINIQIINFLN